jgi:hypothetical protein
MSGRANPVGTSECPDGQRHDHHRVAEPDHAEILSVACRFRNDIPKSNRPTAIEVLVLRRWDRRPAPERARLGATPSPGGFPLAKGIGRSPPQRSAELDFGSPPKPPPDRPTLIIRSLSPGQDFRVVYIPEMTPRSQTP